MRKIFKTITIIMFLSELAWACATCYGDPDSPATYGMNGAIITLLAVTGGVLSGVIGTFFSLKKKAKKFYVNQNSDDLENISI